jgi:hypothetical protein
MRSQTCSKAFLALFYRKTQILLLLDGADADSYFRGAF